MSADPLDVEAALVVAQDLLAEAHDDMERESEFRGSSYDFAVQRVADLELIVAALDAGGAA